MANGLHTEGYTDPMTNPGAANAAIASLMRDTQPVEKPVIELPAGGHVRLLGGVPGPNGYQYAAEVRELTGVHEEAITKARQAGVEKFLSTLLQSGTVSVGEVPATAEQLDDLLLGDRDLLLLEIRRATYGEEVIWDEYTCPHCLEEFRLSVTLDEIPIRPLEGTKDAGFAVDLRNGRKAFARLPRGADQRAVLAISERSTVSEVNTLLLSRCLISIVEVDGTENAVFGSIEAARALGIVDRKAIMDAFEKRQPGPQYNEIKFTHDSCGKEVPVFMQVGDLFQGL